MPGERTQRQIDRLLDEAEQAITARDWVLVQTLTHDALALDPDNVEARDFLAAAERRLASNVGDRANPAAAGMGPSLTDDSGNRPVHSMVPTTFASGRYAVKRLLGEGGKKQVYLAHDSTLDRDVAFALIKTDGLDDTARERIAREAQAMGRLGAHPHIVTVFDLGTDAGQPYMVTELMDGGDVEAVIAKAQDGRLPMGQALSIAVQVCQGLEFAHARGIVHRDLKPGNVWLTADGVAKIGDFGLAVAIDRTSLTQAGMMVGTVLYMPPEQALGGDVTPRSDLYSLGAMLYEMVCGRAPYLGDDSVAVIGQHINTAPVAPSWHNPDCPRALEALILRMLAKDPSERPASAADVRAALEAIDLGARSAEEPSAADARILDSLAGGTFVGRQREMGELKAALEDALSGRGRMLTLVGEPGIGKTRTAQELATYAGLRQAQVLWGRCYEGPGAPPYWPWVQAVRTYVQDRDPAQLRSELGAGAADIAEVISDLRERIPGLRTPPALEPDQARFRLFDSIATFLKNAARHQPLVLILEDLHWADRPSLLLLEFLARDLANARLLVIGTYRDVDISRRHPLAQSLAELTREQLFQRILMRGLAEADVARFIELVAGVAASPGLVEAVYRQTEGNPLFVTEVVRLLVQEGHLSSLPSHSRTEGPEMGVARSGADGAPLLRIPEGVREVIGRRLDRLSERCNQVLTIASIVGREFTLEHLQPLVDDLPNLRLLEVLEEALSARIIEELPRAAGRYQFTHALIQETLAEELSTTRRVHLHARIAESMEAVYGRDAEAHAAELSFHFGEAATVAGTDKLMRYSLLAGERALVSHAYEEALGFFQRALTATGVSMTGAQAAQDAETAALLFGLGRAQIATFPLHRISEAVGTMHRAFDYYERSGDVERVVDVAEYPLPTIPGFATGGLELLDRALALIPLDSLQAVRLLSLKGRLLGLEANDYAGALMAIERALETARNAGDIALEMRVLVDAAEVDGYQSSFKRALSRAFPAIELAARTDDPRCEMVAHYWAVLGCLALGDASAAESHAAQAMVAAERLRYHFLLARALFGYALVRRLLGDWEGAREATERALTVSPQEVRALYLGVLLHFEAGEISAGQGYLKRLLEATRLMPPGPSMGHAYCSSAVGMAAYVTEDSEQSAIGREMARMALSSSRVTPTVATLSREGLALLGVEPADEEVVREQYAFFDGNADADWIVLLAPSDRHHLLGVLASALGDWTRACGHFEESVAFCRKAGYLPSLAWTCVDYAHALLELDRAGGAPTSAVRATKLLDDGLRIAREAGMKPLVERALRHKELLTA